MGNRCPLIYLADNFDIEVRIFCAFFDDFNRSVCRPVINKYIFLLEIADLHIQGPDNKRQIFFFVENGNDEGNFGHADKYFVRLAVLQRRFRT